MRRSPPPWTWGRGRSSSTGRSRRRFARCRPRSPMRWTPARSASGPRRRSRRWPRPSRTSCRMRQRPAGHGLGGRAPATALPPRRGVADRRSKDSTILCSEGLRPRFRPGAASPGRPARTCARQRPPATERWSARRLDRPVPLHRLLRSAALHGDIGVRPRPENSSRELFFSGGRPRLSGSVTWPPPRSESRARTAGGPARTHPTPPRGADWPGRWGRRGNGFRAAVAVERHGDAMGVLDHEGGAGGGLPATVAGVLRRPMVQTESDVW